MAAAAFATAFLAKDFVVSRHTAFFESLGNEAIHLGGHFLKYFLGSHKSLNALVSVSLIL